MDQVSSTQLIAHYHCAVIRVCMWWLCAGCRTRIRALLSSSQWRGGHFRPLWPALSARAGPVFGSIATALGAATGGRSQALHT